MTSRTYLSFDPRAGYPAGKTIVYECGTCGGLVRSMPAPGDAWRCTCGSVSVDADAGRVSVSDPSRMRAFDDA